MNVVDQEVAVIRLACQTEDRGPEEQRALLEFAHRIDKRRASRVVTNDPIRPELFELALTTASAETVSPPATLLESHHRLVERFDGVPSGDVVVRG